MISHHELRSRYCQRCPRDGQTKLFATGVLITNAKVSTNMDLALLIK